MKREITTKVCWGKTAVSIALPLHWIVVAVCLQYENIICTQPSLSLGVEMAQAFADGPLRYAGGHLLHSSLRPVMKYTCSFVPGTSQHMQHIPFYCSDISCRLSNVDYNVPFTSLWRQLMTNKMRTLCLTVSHFYLQPSLVPCHLKRWSPLQPRG